MDGICMTRAIKNIKYIQRAAPQVFNRETLQEIFRLPPETLSSLQTIRPQLVRHTKLADFLQHNRIPMAKSTVSGPLFSGTLVFVQITFNRTGQPPFSMSTADTQMAVNYATRAAIPMHAYALQYGPNTINVSQNIINFTANLGTNTTFDDATLQGWVNTIVNDNNLTNSCIVVLADTSGPRNSAATGSTIGYHNITDNIPYCFAM
jgi:hypothetical protein